MIRRLERRMIALVLAGLLAVSAGLVAAINLMNRHIVIGQIEQVLDTLAENDGQRPFGIGAQAYGGDAGDEFTEDGADGARAQPPGADGDRWPEAARGPWRGLRENLLSAAGLSNFYTITLDEDGAVIGWTSDRMDLYSDDDIEDLAARVCQRQRDSGRIDAQFYRRVARDDGSMLIVVDARMDMLNVRNVLRTTALVALAADALLSAGAIWLIRRMIRPVNDAFERQKQFVWDASHELKTPLAVISANAQILSGEIGPNESLEYIRSEVDRSDHLIQSLLTLARMDKGTVTANRQRFDVSRAVLSVALPFESAVFEAGKTLELDVPDGITAVGDEEMIKQLTVILLSNAEKYSDPGGRIDVRLEAKGEHCQLKVHNTGEPIPKEAQAKIFDRFYRVDTSHNSEIPGNGLGLSIAQSIINAHRGRLQVRSESGEGTTFTATF